MRKEFNGWLTSVFILWAFNVCPNGYFKSAFAKFIKENINNL